MERCSSDLRNWMYQDILNINDDKIDFFFLLLGLDNSY